MNSKIEVKTISKKQINQDYCSTFFNKNLQVKGIIVADGLGSHYKSEIGSEICTNSLKKQLEEFDTTTPNFIEIFQNVLTELKEYGNNLNEISSFEDKSKVFGTTLICLVEYTDRVIFAYVGNGSIWHIRGNYSHFSEQRYLPWSSINLLNPHTNEENGKEALYKYFSFESTNEEIEPTVIEILKDNKFFGDIFIVSTDGLYSNDQISIAKDREGGLWIEGDLKMEKLYKKIKSSILNIDSENLEINVLSIQLESFLNEVKENKLLDDDLTLGVLITDQVYKYHDMKNENNPSN